MSEVVDFPKRPFDTGGGGGSGRPPLSERVAAVEKSVMRIELKLERHDEAFRRVEEALKSISVDIKTLTNAGFDLREKAAHIDGRLANIPTFWQTLALIATLLIGIAGLLFTSSKVLHP